jgi:hypothetical protein
MQDWGETDDLGAEPLHRGPHVALAMSTRPSTVAWHHSTDLDPGDVGRYHSREPPAKLWSGDPFNLPQMPISVTCTASGKSCYCYKLLTLACVVTYLTGCFSPPRTHLRWSNEIHFYTGSGQSAKWPGFYSTPISCTLLTPTLVNSSPVHSAIHSQVSY